MRVDWDNPVDMDHPLNRGLVAWWMAGEGPYWGGPLFRDLVPKSSRGGGNHGTLTNGPTWGGHLGRPSGFGSLTFDGSNDVVTTPAAITIATTGTVSMWARRTGDGPGLEIFLSHTTDSSSTRWRMDAEAGNFRVSYGNDINSLDTGADFVANQWHHIAITWNGGTFRAFFDGVRVLNFTGATHGFPTSSNVLYFGDYEASGHEFAGQLDDIRFYSVALADDLIQAIRLESMQGYPQTLNWQRTKVGQAQADAAVTYSQYWWNTSYDYSGLGV